MRHAVFYKSVVKPYSWEGGGRKETPKTGKVLEKRGRSNIWNVHMVKISTDESDEPRLY